MIYDAERRKGGGPVLGVRPGSGRPGPFGNASGFDLDDELGQEAAELVREVAEEEMPLERFGTIVTGAAR